MPVVSVGGGASAGSTRRGVAGGPRRAANEGGVIKLVTLWVTGTKHSWGFWELMRSVALTLTLLPRERETAELSFTPHQSQVESCLEALMPLPAQNVHEPFLVTKRGL